MKTLLLFILSFFIITNIQESKHSLISHKWVQVAFKENKDKKRKAPAKGSAKEIEFSNDGTYQTTLYGITEKGKWQFNSDSTKFGWNVTESNGQKISTSVPIVTNLIILKLTADSLIFGDESGYGTTPKTYGHDDWYFIRSK